jgi:DNA-binding transcriptional LysR family regulator
MSSPNFSWEDARYFLALARHGTLGRAAQSLNISSITLSRHLAYLQSRTRTTLFSRQSKGLKLTDEGIRLLEYLERAEAEIEAASEIFGTDPNQASGTVRIAAPEGFAVKILSRYIEELLNAHPKLSIEIVPQSRGFSLSKREADIAVMVGKPDEAKLNYQKIGTYRLGLYASPTYLEEYGIPKSINDLSRHRLIGYVEDLLYSNKLNIHKQFWLQWKSALSIYSPIGQVEAVKAGSGIGMLHQFLIDTEKSLVRILPEVEMEREFYVVYHQSTEKIPRIKTAITFLSEIGKRFERILS